jgi:hypothetical protein
MFRPLLTTAAALVLAALWTATAEAQFNMRNLRFPASLQNAFMIGGEEVQTELGMSDEQKTKANDLGLQLRQEAFEIMSGLQDLTPDEQKEAMGEVMNMIAEKGKEVEGRLDELLDDKQAVRLKELSLQARGAQALEDEDVIAALKITDDQKKKLTEIRETGLEALQAAFGKLREAGGDQGELRAKMQKLREELNEQALAVLTASQRSQFDKMKGTAFKFPPRRGGLPF